MGIAFCKSMCSSKSKKQTAVINGSLAQETARPATAADYQISTVQNAVVMTQESQQIAMTIATASIANEPDDNFVEKIACNESDLEDNGMKEVDMGGDKKLLLIRQSGKFYAIGAKCAHNGAPLTMGVLGDGRIRCPWHGACFNIETGDIEDSPGLDSLPCFQVKVEKGVVKVRARKSDLESDKRVKTMATRDAGNDKTFVIVGGGPSAQTCAETLRQNGFQGRVVMICKEKFLPYDRIKVSKSFSSKIDELQLRSQAFYDENQIEVSLNVEAESLNTTLKEISLNSGDKLKYDKIFVATGSRPKKSFILGSDLENIFSLRNLDDAHNIDSKLKSTSHVVILGSSFISMEAAAYCVGKVAKVTIIGRSSVPLIDTFGEEIGKRIMQLFESKNVEFIMNSGIKCFFAINQEEHLSAVKLLNDDILKADVCIIGIGSELNTNFLHNSGLSINEDCSIDTDLFLETNVADVYVGGDIANSPVFANGNKSSTIGHYGLAQHHGRIAGLNMIGLRTELKAVPYFFTYLFEHCFTYAGHGEASEIFIEGDLESLKFSAFYFDQKQNVVAMSSCQPDKSIAKFAEKLAQGKRFVKKDLLHEFGVNTEAPRIVKDASSSTENYVEAVACNDYELDDNEMREIDMGDNKKVLLIKQNGKFTAVGANCSHYSVPLVTAALSEGRIRCPWHGACFNIETGDIEDFPGLDSLPCFQVKVEKGVVKIRAKKSDLQNEKRVISIPMKSSPSGEIFVIIGGGPSAQTCAETLRQNGFQGRILMICKEKFLPYDRIKVSKMLDIKADELQLRSQAFYDENHIEVTLNAAATSLDVKVKEISLSCGSKLKYDKLYIATGLRAKKSDLPGSDLENIFTLRNVDDAHSIDSKLKSTSHVVILGSSFIAMEAAAYCVEKVAKVTVVGRSSVPLIDTFGEVIGNRIMQLFKTENVEFIMNSGIKSFHGNYKNLESIVLLSGKTLWADICIVGIGSEPNTDFLHDSGLLLNKNGSIDTSVCLETNIADVFVGGDIANSPIFTNNNELASISHYSLAQHHGKVAALNMMGLRTELRAVPYYFTYLFKRCFSYTGHGVASEIFIEGDLDALEYVAFYFDNRENVIAMSSCQPDKSIAEFAEKLAQGYRFHKSDIEWMVNETEE